MKSIEETQDVSLRALLSQTAQSLAGPGIANPRWVAEQLLARRLGQSRAEMLLEPAPLTDEIQTRFLADVAACAAGVPMQYVMGSAVFFGREFLVGPGVFIPRPETEGLVEAVLARFDERPRKVLDVGAGSGAIAVTLALERPAWQVMAVEWSEAALAFAWRNAEALKARVEFRRGDLAAGFGADSLDGIVANLPYLNPKTVAQWLVELHWEPWLAQDGGAEGLDVIRRLIPQAAEALRPEGLLALEIGEEQAPAVSALAGQNNFEISRILPDLAGRDRVVILRKGL